MPFDLSRRAALTGALSLPFMPASAVTLSEAGPSKIDPTRASETPSQLCLVGPWEKATVIWHNPFRKFGFLTQSDGSFQIFFRASDVGVPGIYLRPGIEVFVRSYAQPGKSLPQAAALAPITAPKVLRVFELVSKHYNCPIGATWQPVDDNGYAKLARKTSMYLASRISSLPIEALASSIVWGSVKHEADLRDNIKDWRDAVEDGERDRIDNTRASEDTEELYQSILRAGPGPLDLKVRITTKLMQHKSLVS